MAQTAQDYTDTRGPAAWSHAGFEPPGCGIGRLKSETGRLNLTKAQWGYPSANHRPRSSAAARFLRMESSQQREGSLEMLYHFCEGAAILTLRGQRGLYPACPSPSICEILPYATLYEPRGH